MHIFTQSDKKRAIILPERSKRPFPEFIFLTAYFIVIALTIGFMIGDFFAIAPNEIVSQNPASGNFISNLFTDPITNEDKLAALTMPLYNEPILSIALLVIATGCLVLVVLDLATYQPRLFALASFSIPSGELFNELGVLSISLRQYLTEIASTPPTSYRSLKIMEENLIIEVNHFDLLDDLRYRITRRILLRFICIVLALSLCAYLLSSLTAGHFIHGLAPDPTFLKHIYYTSVLFFTIGFGDITPYHNVVGYLFVDLCAIILVIITYFIFSTILSGYYDFEDNIRRAAHNYIITLSRF
jgi:hypothetical protein